MKSVLPLLICLFLGVLIGWKSVATPSYEAAEVPDREPAKQQRETVKGKPRWKGEDFYQAILEKTSVTADPTSSSMSALLDAWTDEEIRGLLDEALLDPSTLTRDGSIAEMILKEYMQRDLNAALDWFGDVPPIHQANLLPALCQAWPAARVTEGVQFIFGNKKLFAGAEAPAWSIISKAIALKAEQGPGSVVAFINEMNQEGLNLHFQNTINYPQGFDFAGLLGTEAFGAPVLQELRQSALTAWRAQNRDAAFDWILENGSATDLHSLSVYQEDTSMEQVDWLVRNLDRTNPEQRAILMEDKFNEWMGIRSDALRWIEQARTPELKEEIRTVAAQGLYFARPHPALEVIGAIPMPEERLRFMETLQISAIPRGKVVPLKAENETIIRAKLIEWGADSARAEMIINRYKIPSNP